MGEANGRKIVSGEKNDFCQEIGYAIGMPDNKIEEIGGNIMWFVDELEDLWWYDDGEKYESYYIAIEGGLSYITDSKDIDWKKFYIDHLKSVIKHWTVEAPKVVAGSFVRNFTVYLVEDSK